MSTMKLQKLCYYSQAWSLVWDEKPLYREPIQAWANGPVTYALFDKHRGKFRVSGEDISGNPDSLAPEQVDTINAVRDGYGHLSGQQLSDLTHRERPWIDARAGLPDGHRSEVIIDLDSLQDFYGGLAANSGD